MAELARRGLLLPVSLPKVVPVIIKVIGPLAASEFQFGCSYYLINYFFFWCVEIIDGVYPGSVLHFILLLREFSAILWLSGDLFCNFTKKSRACFCK